MLAQRISSIWGGLPLLLREGSILLLSLALFLLCMCGDGGLSKGPWHSEGVEGSPTRVVCGLLTEQQ